MLTLGIPVIGVEDVERASEFWTAALGLVASDEWKTEDWQTLWRKDGSARALGLMRSQSPVEPRPRIHLDLFVDTADQQETEVDRLLALGATKPDWDSYPDNPDFVVLADPDGNVFCIVDLSHAPSS